MQQKSEQQSMMHENAHRASIAGTAIPPPHVSASGTQKDIAMVKGELPLHSSYQQQSTPNQTLSCNTPTNIQNESFILTPAAAATGHKNGNTTAVLKQLVKMTGAGLSNSRQENVQQTLSTSHVTQKLMEVYGSKPIIVAMKTPMQSTPVRGSVVTPTQFSRRSISMQQPSQQLHQQAYARLRANKQKVMDSKRERFQSRTNNGGRNNITEDGNVRMGSQLQTRQDQLKQPDMTTTVSQTDKSMRPPRLLEPIQSKSTTNGGQQSKEFNFEPASQMILSDNETMIFHPNSSKTQSKGGKQISLAQKKSLGSSVRIQASNSKVTPPIPPKVTLPSPYISTETAQLLMGRGNNVQAQSSSNLHLQKNNEVKSTGSFSLRKHGRKKSKGGGGTGSGRIGGALQAAGMVMSSRENIFLVSQSPSSCTPNEDINVSRDLSYNNESLLGMLSHSPRRNKVLPAFGNDEGLADLSGLPNLGDVEE